MCTSSSSPTYPATQRQHPVHPAHLQAPSIDKLRHQGSLWRKDLQSGGNPRTTTPTGYERKELATSMIEAYSCSLTSSSRRLPSFVGKRTSRQECVSGSNRPAEAMLWMKEVEVANSVDDLKTSRSYFGRGYPSFETLDARIATALKKIIQNSKLTGRVHSEEQKTQKRRLIATWHTDRLHDLRILPGDGYSRDHFRFL